MILLLAAAIATAAPATPAACPDLVTPEALVCHALEARASGDSEAAAKAFEQAALASADSDPKTARLWADLGFWAVNGDQSFHIHGVTGPDEYNTVVNDNFFTNVMAQQNLRVAADTAALLAAAATKRGTLKYDIAAEIASLESMCAAYTAAAVATSAANAGGDEGEGGQPWLQGLSPSSGGSGRGRR